MKAHLFFFAQLLMKTCSKKNCTLKKVELMTRGKLEISLPSFQRSHDSAFCAACETAIARAAKLYIHVIYPSYFQTTHRPYKFPISSTAFIETAFRWFCTIKAQLYWLVAMRSIVLSQLGSHLCSFDCQKWIHNILFLFDICLILLLSDILAEPIIITCVVLSSARQKVTGLLKLIVYCGLEAHWREDIFMQDIASTQFLCTSLLRRSASWSGLVDTTS